MRFSTKLISATATAGLLSASLLVPISVALAVDYSGDHPFTAVEAKLIHEGKIVFDDGSPTGLVDLSLFKGSIMNPDGDDDFDGIPNKDELHVYSKDGQQYLHYLSHPKLKDTDGDGLADKADNDPLSWDIHARDAVIFQELSYRDDDYELKILGQDSLDGKQSVETAYDKSMAELPESDWHENRMHYPLMRREVAPFWNAVKTWHTRSGFDATMYEFSNKTFPYLKDKSTHVLGIRGTSDGKDIAMDAALGTGWWMGQGTDTQNVANELAGQQERYKNVYVAGHSLGGYLAQIFFTHSVGKKYGDESVNGEDNYNYKEPHKNNNTEIKQVFGFNAPRIIYNLFQPYLKEYYWLSKYLDQKFPNKYFQVNNDIFVRSHPDAVTYIGKSDNGHSSTSFWEKKFANVEGFSVGARNDLSNTGYQETALKSVQFVHRTIVKIQENGKEIAEVVLPKTKDEITNINKDALAGEIDPSIVIDTDPVNLKYGEVNTLQGHTKKIDVTYKFVVDGQTGPVATKVVQTKYKADYIAPEIPVSTDPDYKYVLQVNPMPKVPVEELTEDKTLTVTLIKEPIIVSTKVIFKDGDKTVKTITKETKPSEAKSTLVASDFPEGYVIPNPLPTLQAGQDNEISVKKQTFTLTFKYMNVDDNNAVVGAPATETVKYGEDSKYELAIPDGYQLADDYSFSAPADVKADATVEIKIQPKKAENWQLTFVYKYNGRKVGTQVATVTTGSGVHLQPPSHSDPNKSYVLKNKSDSPYKVVGSRPTNGKQSVDIDVLEKEISPNPIPAVPTPVNYNITLNYIYAGDTVKTETKQLRKDAPITLEIPTSETGNYALDDGVAIPAKATKNETINVPLKFTANKYPVTVRYIYTKDGNSEVLETENQQVEHGKKPVIKNYINGETSGRYYQLAISYQAPKITKAQTIDVPMEHIVDSYQVTVKYMDGNDQVGNNDVQQVKDGETATLHLPNATNFDGSYLLADGFNNPPITEDRTLKVPLKRQLNTYEVTVNYQYEGKTKANSFQVVESGKMASNDYKAVVNSNNDEHAKAELAKYEVDPSFNWSLQITEKTTLNVPLKRKVQAVNVPAVPDVTDPCGEDNATWVKPVDNDEITWKETAEKHLVASTTEGYIFKEDTSPGGVAISADKRSIDYGVAKDSGIICWVSIVKPPVLQGVTDKTVNYGASFNPHTGVKAVGGKGADLSNEIIISGSVNTSAPGAYTLIYSVTENGVKVSKTITITVKAKPAGKPFTLNIVKGMGQTWIVSSNDGAVFKSTGTYDPKVLKVFVDGKLISSDKYTAWKGSTYVKLSPEYLRTLKLGKHTLGITSKEGTAETDFYILPKKDVVSTLNVNHVDLASTGSQTGIFAGLGVLLALVGLALCHRRKKQH